MSSEPPEFTYSPPGAAKGAGGDRTGKAQSPYIKTVNKVFTVLTWVVLFVVLTVWAVVGAVFWIPLLLRAMLRFSISLIEAMFEGHKPSRAARILRDAVSFYRRGFVVAVEVVTREPARDDEEGPVTEHRLLLEILWALLVWYFIFLIFGWIQASPLDLWDWLVSIPWGDYFGDLGRRLRG